MIEEVWLKLKLVNHWNYSSDVSIMLLSAFTSAYQSAMIVIFTCMEGLFLPGLTAPSRTGSCNSLSNLKIGVVHEFYELTINIVFMETASRKRFLLILRTILNRRRFEIFRVDYAVI